MSPLYQRERDDHPAVGRSQMLKRVEGDRSLRDLRVVVVRKNTSLGLKPA
jgi:hypothetical protein